MTNNQDKDLLSELLHTNTVELLFCARKIFSLTTLKSVYVSPANLSVCPLDQFCLWLAMYRNKKLKYYSLLLDVETHIYDYVKNKR